MGAAKGDLDGVVVSIVSWLGRWRSHGTGDKQGTVLFELDSVIE